MNRSITIIGGGIAGLSLGNFLLRRGVGCTVIDSGTYPRHKVCGEFVSPRNPEFLERCGLSDLFADAGHARSVAWFWPGGEVSRFTLGHPARTISRHTLDARLASQFTALGGELQPGTRFDTTPHRNTPGMVFATGRVRPAGENRWVGMKMHFALPALAADLEMHTGTGGYTGLCEVDPGIFNVSGLFRAECIAGGAADRAVLFAGALQNAGLGRLSRWLSENGTTVPHSFTSVSHLDFSKPSTDDSTVRIGDAFAMIPPLTGNGMSLAMESAWAVAPVLEDYACGRCEWGAARSACLAKLRGGFSGRLSRARIAQRLLLNPVASRVVTIFAKSGLFPWRWLHQSLG